MDEKSYYILQTAEEADMISDEDLEHAVDWFDGQPSMPRDEFFDRLFTRYSGPTCPIGSYDEFDLDQLDNAAARRLIARARKLRKAREE
jgi:hypothetical protein